MEYCQGANKSIYCYYQNKTEVTKIHAFDQMTSGYVHTVDTQTCYMARFGNTAGVARF